MGFLKPLLIALSTYTRLPLPHVRFEETDMKYSMCFFPLAGVLVGIVFWLWDWLSLLLSAGSLLRAAGFVLVPLLVTGGIHMDGFIDTSDALSSWQSKEKKLEILKDPHIGAFGVIRAAMYLLALLGLYSQLRSALVPLVALGFELSRCLTMLMFNLLPNARGSGMLSSFQTSQDKRVVLLSAAVFSVLSVVLGLVISPKALFYGLLLLGLTALWFFSMAKRKFGGITGDLAGFLIQCAELAFAIGVILLGGIA